MKKLNSQAMMPNFVLGILALLVSITGFAQPATINIPVGIGSANCGSSTDSIKYYDYNANLDLLTHRWNCRPSLVAPGFSDALATIQFNPYDGNLYFGQITSSFGVYTTHMYRWLPTVCPGPNLPKYQVFSNQLVAGMEFDPATGLGYQINFVDASGDPPLQVDNAATLGLYTSAAIVNGNPAISYYDQSNGNLKYVRANDPQGRTWGTPVNIVTADNIGQYTSMVIVNGNPAIAYYDLTLRDLKYVRANDALGTTWGAPVAVVTAGDVGEYASMAIVNGYPAITYYDNSNDDLEYVRATNANGTAWGAAVVIDAGGNVGQHTSLKVVNGNPAVSYLDVSNTSLKYIRATDANGTAWATSITVSNADEDGYYSSLEVVNGNPAIAHYENNNGALKYVRANDANGTTWPASASIVTAGSSGQHASLKVVNGNPAIAYYDGSDLEYIRATDANGTSWGTVVVPESANTVGSYASLIIANGNPAVAYYGSTSSDLRFIRSADANGDSWYANSSTYNMELQQVDFTTNSLGLSLPIDFGTHYIYRQSGDVVMTPSGQMLGIFDNKYFNLNWRDYNTATPLVATFIDSIDLGTAGHNLIGLSYSDGKLIGSIRRSSTTCYYREVDILTGSLSNITNVSNNFSSADMTSIPTGVGSAKRLVSAVENPVGSGIYDIVYNVRVRNFGGTPISNLQVYDTLNMINGFANLISGSVTSITGPAGITANPAYNGKTVFSLLTPGSTLSNIPGQNIIDIQITCRVANILPGIVYYNQAAVSATNIFGDPLRDLSTNGNNPDLNLNDKPDDIGEAQPTPLLISVAAVTPPCATLTNVLYTQTFGTGTGLSTTISSPVAGSGVASVTGVTDYAGSTSAAIPIETYTITNNANNANAAHFINLTDHTGNPNGSMLLVNADANNTVFYRGRINMTGSLCANQQYSLSFYAAFIGNSNYQTVCDAFGGFQYPKIKMRIRDGVSAGNPIITEISTPDITNISWQQYGLKFISPASYTQIIIELVNDAPGGCGNDLVIDDIEFGICDPTPTVSIGSLTDGCLGGSTIFTSDLDDPAALPGAKDYQWQVSTLAAGPWVDIAGANTATYNIPVVGAGDVGKYYRVIVAAAGNIGNISCRYTSTGILLTAKTPSVAATSATKSRDNICPGMSVNLALVGGSLGTNAQWHWYSGSCGGTAIGTGTGISVSPTVTTTYYVRAEGDCNNTACVAVTVFISCDIDKDKDGIPDYVESYTMPIALTQAFNTGYAGYVDNNNDYVNDNFQADGDSDGDGIPNYQDTNFAGRIDSNGDGVDDRFDFDLDGIINMLDLDSDNDGIPDVVEAGGVDVNGDGQIDNYTDTDGDGLSQNVDGNNTGATNSGNGLGAVNLDNTPAGRDLNPNAIDLDSDNDGIPDVIEAGGADANNDGIIDGFVDTNNDGLHDAYILGTALLPTGIDINADGRADIYPFKNYDSDSRPNAYDIDSDMDGITDVQEAGFIDGINGVGSDGFIDGSIGADGWSVTVNSQPTLIIRNSDSDPNPDYLDIDSDNDGIPDNVEGLSTAGYRLPQGADSDNDGLDNAYEIFGPFTTIFGGPGVYPNDHDMDAIPDYLDQDTDSDGSPDLAEGHDYNGNGVADDGAILSGLDTDGDGLDDTFDLINGLSDISGTSAFMGNGGTFVGDATPGSSSSVQMFVPSQIDRDWRYVDYVLDVQLLRFDGTLKQGEVMLNWSLITTQNIDHFEIERSLDNQHFETIQNLQRDVPLQTISNFFTQDYIAGIDAQTIYYKLKIVGANGQIKYSSVVAIKLSKTVKTGIQIVPNPTKDNVQASFYATKDATAIIRIVDNLGKTIYLRKHGTVKGQNNIMINGLSKFPDAVYSIQIILPDQLLTQKLIIQNQ